MLQKIFSALLALLFPLLQAWRLDAGTAPVQTTIAAAAESAADADSAALSDAAAQARRFARLHTAAPEASSQAIDGDGYTLISGAADLQAINNDLAGKYRLTRDISLSGKTFTGIGSFTKPFTGELDGAGYAIQSLKLADSVTLRGDGAAALGLVAFNQGYIHDLQIPACSIRLTANAAADATEPAAYAGAIAGCSWGRIENCVVSGTVEITGGAGGAELSASVGGAVGFQICPALPGAWEAGLFGTVSLASAAAAGAFYYAYVGGLLGYAMNGPRVLQCVARSAAQTQNTTGAAYVGGLAGMTESAEPLAQCAAFGAAAAHSTGGSAFAGGLVGYASTVEIADCVAFGGAGAFSDAAAKPNRRVCAGGLLGRAYGATLSACYAMGTPTAVGAPEKWTGGGVGYETLPFAPARACYYLDSVATQGVGSGISLIEPLTRSQLGAIGSYVGFDFFDVWSMLPLAAPDGGEVAYPRHAGTAIPDRTPEPEPPLPRLLSCSGSVVVDDENALIYGVPDSVVAENLFSRDYTAASGAYLYIVGEGEAFTTTPWLVATGTRLNLYAEDGTLLRGYTVIVFGDCVPDGRINSDDVIYAKGRINLTGVGENAIPRNIALALALNGKPNDAFTVESYRRIYEHYVGASQIPFTICAAALRQEMERESWQ